MAEVRPDIYKKNTSGIKVHVGFAAFEASLK
jgi:hypothetical protein